MDRFSHYGQSHKSTLPPPHPYPPAYSRTNSASSHPSGVENVGAPVAGSVPIGFCLPSRGSIQNPLNCPSEMSLSSLMENLASLLLALLDDRPGVFQRVLAEELPLGGLAASIRSRRAQFVTVTLESSGHGRSSEGR